MPPSPPSTRPSGSPERRSSAFVRERPRAARSSRRQGEQQPGARGHTGNAGGTRDPSSDRRDFLQQDKQGQKRNPQQVHHPTDEQKRHQDPAAADTIGAVTKPQQ